MFKGVKTHETKILPLPASKNITCCSLVDSCHLIYLPAFDKNLGTDKFILHPNAAVNPLTAYEVIKLA